MEFDSNRKKVHCRLVKAISLLIERRTRIEVKSNSEERLYKRLVNAIEQLAERRTGMEFTPGSVFTSENNDDSSVSIDEEFWDAMGEEYGEEVADLVTPIEPERIQVELQETSTQEKPIRTRVVVDMSHMDRLLSKDDIDDLDDLGAEVFQMLDRFNSAIHQFGREYSAACNERERSINEIQADTKRRQQRMEQEHSANLNKIKQDAERDIENLRIQLRKGETDRQNKLQAAANELKRFRATSEAELTKLHVANVAQSSALEKHVLGEVTVYYDAVHELVGRRFASLLEEAQSQCSFGSLSDEQFGYSLSEKCVEEAKSLYDSIYIECQKIVRRRLPMLCERLGTVCGQARQAHRMLLDKHKRTEEAAKADYEAEAAKREKAFEQLKRLNQGEDESKQREFDMQTSQIRSSKEARIIEENKKYQNAKSQTNAALQEQETNLKNRWYRDLATRVTSFFQRMEVAFPAARMRELYNKMEAMVGLIMEPFDRGTESRRSIAIGTAKVDFIDSKEVNPEAYRIILDWVKSNYQFMQDDPRDLRKIVVPYIVSVENGPTLLLKYKDCYEGRIKTFVNGIGIRMLWSIPASLQEFCLIDPASIGSYATLQYMDPAQNPAGAGELIKSLLVGGKVFQKKEDMARQIDEMRTRFESRKGSMGSFKTLREFNSSNFMSREAYQTAIIQHFPMNLEADSVMSLTAMVRDCRNAGFSAILAMPETSESYMEEQVKLRVRELESNVTVLQFEENGSFVTTSNCQTEAERSAQISIFPISEDGRLEEMRADFFEASMGALKVAIDFNSVAPEAQRRYRMSSAQGLVIPLGLMRGGSMFELRMDDIHIHTILSGVTRAGKTNLLHVLLMNTMLRYSPDEVEIYLIDFKHGVDFSIYSNYNLPNFRVLSITSEAEFPLAALEEVEKEFDRRAYDLEDTLSIAEYNRMHPESRMKRILLILDELYVLMEDSAKDGNQYIAERILRIIDKIAHMAGAFGIHMIISGQDITKIDGINSIITQCANRIVMHSSDEDVNTLLGDGDAAALMHEIKPSSQGTCVFSNDYAVTAKLAYTAKNESASQGKLLESISRHYTDLGENANVRILLTEPSKSKYHPFRRFVDEGVLPEKDQLFLGEALTLLKDFSYYPEKNLWILGGDSPDAEMAGCSAMFSSLLSLLLGKLRARDRGEDFEILCSDGSDDGTGDIDRNDRFWQFCDSLMEQGDLIHYVPGTELSMHIRKLMETIARRKEGENANHPIWFLISMVDECYGVSDQDKMALRKILDDGPRKGVHTILWTKDAEFAKRFHLSDAPCDKLILETADLDGFGVKIKMNLSVGYKVQMLGAKGARLRLYDLPVQPWVERILQRIDRL